MTDNSENKNGISWRVIAATVPGASHIRAGVPNQDAVLQLRESSTGLPLVLAVSDGHGSDKCFRSDRGSHFAVTIGAALMRELLYDKRENLLQEELEARAKGWLPKEFVGRWRAAVEADIGREKFTKEELKKLEQKGGAPALRMIEKNPLLVYGATTLTIALDESFIIYLQLGDGEILTVSETGEVTKPLPEDARLLANETTSLCLDKAAEDFRFSLQPLAADNLPALIIMTTDGYANSFTDDAGFLKVGGDLLEMLRTDGFDSVDKSVEGWLEEATRSGSGDDSTLGIVCRMNALETITETSAPTVAATTTDSPITPPETVVATTTEAQDAPPPPDSTTSVIDTKERVTIVARTPRRRTAPKPLVPSLGKPAATE